MIKIGHTTKHGEKQTDGSIERKSAIFDTIQEDDIEG